MNALDNEKDPFEDIFRDKLFDFESEPNDKFWKVIEPQLPTSSVRKIPYWQYSAVAILFLLTGIGVYLMPFEMSNETLTKTEERLQLPNSSYTTTAPKNPVQQKSLNYLSEENKGKITEQNYSQDEDKVATSTTENEVVIKETGKEETNQTKKALAKVEQHKFSNSGNIPPVNTTIVEQNEFAGDAKQKGLLANYFKKHSLNKSNKMNRSGVFSDKKEITDDESQVKLTVSTNNISALGNILPSSLEAKAYHPLINHFRVPKIRYRGPKPTVYFKESKPVEWYLSAMPLINYYTITANGNDANYVHDIAVNDDADRLGFYTQAGLMFTLSDRFKLRTGLTFTKTNHSFSYLVRTDSLVVQSPDNLGVDASFAEIKNVYTQSSYYLGTKVDLQYTFLKGESLTHYVNVGVEGAYKVNGSGQFTAIANIAYGVTRQIGDNAYLFVEPTYSYSLSQQSDSNSLLLIKPNKIGFNIGINFKLK